jgi:lipoate-protein ligase B
MRNDPSSPASERGTGPGAGNLQWSICNGQFAISGAPLAVRRLGMVPYGEAVALQMRLLEARRAGEIPDTLVLLEHPPVITCGRGTQPGHILADDAILAQRGVEVHETARGGDVTFHGPGQLVGYPIVDLETRGRDVHRFLRSMEAALIPALARFGIAGGTIPQLTGVWVGNDKIAAIGVAVKRWVTWHGFALNVDVDLAYFDLIVPCGLEGRGVTSMAKLLGAAPPMEAVMDAVEQSFGVEFGAGP